MKITFLQRARHGLLSFALIAGAICGAECGCAPPPSSQSTPDKVNYSGQELRLWATVPMDPLIPSLNFSFGRFVISPDLPPGLSISSVTGRISGTPTVATPETIYRISVVHGEQTLASDTITITVFEALAPGTLTYSPSSSSVAQGTLLSPMLAQFTGTAETIVVVPPLPLGLSIDQDDGTITGLCGALVGVTQHTVTVSNPLGSAQADIQIEVTVGLTVNGVLVASASDGTLDSFLRQGDAFLANDTEHCLGAIPLDTAATPDGRFIYSLMTNGSLLSVARDTQSGFCAPPVAVEQLPFASRLTVSLDGLFLFVTTVQSVRCYAIAPDGSLSLSAQAPGPFRATAILSATPDRLLVGSSSPGEVWCYEHAPAFALRGTAVQLGFDMNIVQFVSTVPGLRAVAITTTYDAGAHHLNGALQDLRLSTDAELSAGAAAVVTVQTVTVGGDLSDACVDTRFTKRILVTDRSLGRVYEYPFQSTGQLLVGGATTFAIGGSPSRILSLPDDLETLVLDSSRAQLSMYEFTFATTTPEYTLSTRSGPVTLAALHGSYPNRIVDKAFVTSSADSTLLAVTRTSAFPPAIQASAQGPVPVGANPMDVAVNQAGSCVYTADSGSGTITALRFESVTAQLTPIETEALHAGAQPIALAITPGGSHLYALDASGSVISMRIDPVDGSLTQTGAQPISGSLAEATLRMDVLARFVFVLQPALGRITTMRLNLPDGEPVSTSVTSMIPDVVDLLPALDGRLVTVVQRASATISELAIGGVSGDLTATGVTLHHGTAPTRLIHFDARPEIEPFTEEDLVLVDPAADLGRSLRRDQATGVSQPTNLDPVLMVNGTETLGVMVFAATACFGISDDAAGPELTIYSFNQASGSIEPIDSFPIGAGPHAVATSFHESTP